LETTIHSRELKEFINEIQYKTRNPKQANVLKLLDDKKTNPIKVLPVGTELFRCRIIHNEADINKEKGFYGYDKKGSFVPPVNNTKDFRANYRYIPYLYCANEPYTALIEVRPRLSASVSVATIRVNAPIYLLDFTMATIPNGMSQSKKDLFSDLSNLYSKPATTDDDTLDYIPTQYIAEYIRELNYDGIIFHSSLLPNIFEQSMSDYQPIDRYNVVIFNYSKCEAIKSNVVCVSYNFLDATQNDNDLQRLPVINPISEILQQI